MGKLICGELVEVGIGYADVNNVRSNVGDFSRQVVGDCMLHGEVPLLNVSGACVAIGGVDALTKACIWSERDGSDGWALGENKGGAQIVLGLLLHVLDEGELGSCKRSGDAGLIDEDDAESGTYDGTRRHHVGKAESGRDVIVVQFAGTV